MCYASEPCYIENIITDFCLIINIPSKFSPGPSSNKCLFDEVDGEVNFVSALLDTANPTLVPASPMLL